MCQENFSHSTKIDAIEENLNGKSSMLSYILGQ